MHKQVQKTYKKVTQIEHILMRPDMYIGSMSEHQEQMWVLEDEEFVFKKIKYIPGLYKIVDQILVNASDNYQRDKKMTKIQVSIGKDQITIVNDGKSIPVQIHKVHKIYVPQLIFGHLLTSSNYQDTEKKVTGGRNGYGAKLANIFSTQFYIQIADSVNRKLLKITWNNNMTVMSEPAIEEYNGQDYTKISFKPDFKRFQINKLTSDMISLLKRRVYDISGVIKVNVHLNRKLVQIPNFKEYVKMYLESDNQITAEYNNSKSRWHVIVCRSEGQFMQVSFVNGICTSKGGSHVNYLIDQIIEKIISSVTKKNTPQIKPFQVKAHLKLFVNCLIDNPSFDSQIKENLTTYSSQFGSACNLPDQFIKQIIKTGITERILNEMKFKENSKIDKELKKVKKNRLIIPKLEDANEAGKSNNCCLILTEGDSAKTLALCGIQQIGRDYYGVYPLKGKPVNVKQLSPKLVMENAQLGNIIKIIGLTFGTQYSNTNSLRYSSVMIMADQDNDGSHIKGLVINFFETFWPSLCKIPGFLNEFITPIIKCTKGSNSIAFYTQADYVRWKQQTTQGGWSIKYYKGLGTSTSKQAKQYFNDLKKHQLFFRYQDDLDKQALDLAFGKKNADLRKEWLLNYNSTICLNHNIKQIKIQDFIHKQLIHFSNSDNIRSIPSAIDGLKPSQRKILFGCFKRNLVNEIKVAQLAGYIAEHSAYHHGQMSLCSTIVSMAQNYVGSNNFNLLQPIGQFGTRHQHGKDAASARYIFTKLNNLTRYLFNESDDHIIEYLQDQNQSIQPKYYLPILPMVLINGCEGIGTGWSTNVIPHKVDDIINMIRDKINGVHTDIEIGWQNFQGKIQKDHRGAYCVKGNWERVDDNIVISELPLNKCVRDYKSFLEELLSSMENQDPHLQDLKEYHRGNHIQFVIKFVEEKEPNDEDMERFLKLSSNYQENNMHLFNKDQKMQKYQNAQQIVNQFYQERLKGYQRRKVYLRSKFQRQSSIIKNQIRFIQQIMQGQFKMMQSKDEWFKRLVAHQFTKYQDLTKIQSTKIKEQDDSQKKKDYNYLLTMPIWSFCQEKINELKSTQIELDTIIQYYDGITNEQLWLKDIDQFEKAWKMIRNGSQVKVYQSSIKKISGHNQNGNGKTQKGQKRKRQTIEIDSQSQSEIVTTKKNRNRKNLMEEQIQMKIQEKQARKKIKKDTIIETLEIKPLTLELPERKQQKRSTIDDLLAKYMCSGPKNQNSLQERIKARISNGDPAFMASYNEAKTQLVKAQTIQKPVHKEQDYNLDWLQQ